MQKRTPGGIRAERQQKGQKNPSRHQRPVPGHSQSPRPPTQEPMAPGRRCAFATRKPTPRASAQNGKPLSEIRFIQSRHDYSPWKRVPTRADATNQLQEKNTQAVPHTDPGVSWTQLVFVKNFFHLFFSNLVKARGSYEVRLKPVRVSICVYPCLFLARAISPEGPISQDPPTPENPRSRPEKQ
jgi:hypothetical protein